MSGPGVARLVPVFDNALLLGLLVGCACGRARAGFALVLSLRNNTPKEVLCVESIEINGNLDPLDNAHHFLLPDGCGLFLQILNFLLDTEQGLCHRVSVDQCTGATHQVS